MARKDIKTKVCLSIEEDLLIAIKIKALKKHISLSQYIENLFKEYLDKNG